MSAFSSTTDAAAAAAAAATDAVHAADAAAAAATDAVDAAAAAAAATDAVDVADATADAISVSSFAKLVGAKVITIKAEWPAPPGTIEHLHKTLLHNGDTFGARFKTVKVDKKSKFWLINGKRNGKRLKSRHLSILRVENNVFTFQSGAYPERYTLEPREECIVAYTDMMSDRKFRLNKETGRYE